METIGPAGRRNATGPLGRLVWRREVPRPAPRRRFWAYAYPLGLLALVGLGFAAAEYLEDNRELPGVVIGIMAAGSVLPVAVTPRLPIWAWRLAYPMMFLGVINADPKESWPWNVVQILGFLVVLGRLAITQDSGLTAGATALSLIPVFLYAKDANAWGAAVLLVAIAALGDILYRRRRTTQLLAEKEELTELERAKRAVLEERTRIAREMHDVVAHHMSMIAVRAETAPYRLPDLPADAQEEMAGIAAAAREALTDMRRLLGVLRSEQGEAEKAPQPGIADLDQLVRTAREAGVEVTYTPDLSEVPGTVGLTAYRIVQEALANAARHAPGKPVTVEARGFPDRLELTVRNALDGEPAAGGGHGLVGMRERAALLGGSLNAGAVESEFVVHAVLPLNSLAVGLT
ncbi:signal transduction histidine kinase [Actinoplanes tereljensis]|uniref:histidine kinase n=1 Tax=Paractinoplanes tereljensis TaxID=571912 RepID=A0A919NM76_9ACTN|nr:histidine kinase [Actinoplanes tereljensis]GIF21369.1 two-component sensor histidine kinase [Actinoplanes tereljensis]